MKKANWNPETAEQIQVRFTKHAEERMHERAGLNRKAARRLAQRALTDGLKRTDAKGRVRQYMDNKYLSRDGNNEIVIYGEMAYIYKPFKTENLLITAFQIPTKLRPLAKRAQK